MKKIYKVKNNKIAKHESYKYDFSSNDSKRIITVLNTDTHGIENLSIVIIERNTFKQCDEEMRGQLSDGIFENCSFYECDEIRRDSLQYEIFEHGNTLFLASNK